MDAPLALYRRYRPETFAEVIGQEHVTDPLRHALAGNKVHHAYLFSGPRGCGKTTSARILARTLNCEQAPVADPCGECQSCRDLARGGPGSVDVIEIDAASHGGVDDARDLRERAFFAPVSSRYKVYIIDEAHMVSPQGFNALLKLVEEPPPHLKFVFATTEPDKVIGTIRSRTHHYPFRLVPPKTLGDYLLQLCQAEGVQLEPTALPLVVRAGAGSVRDTLSILDQLLGGAGADGVTYELAVQLLGYTPDSLLDEAIDAFAANDGSTVFHVVDKVIESGQDPRRFAEDLLQRLRDLIVLAAVPDALSTGLLDVPGDRAERLQQQASRFGPSELTRASDIVNAALMEFRGATAPRLLLELMCARVLVPSADHSAQGFAARLDRIERRLSMGVPQVQQPSEPAAPASSSAPAPAAPTTTPGPPAAAPEPPAPRQAPESSPAPAASPAPAGQQAPPWDVDVRAEPDAAADGPADDSSLEPSAPGPQEREAPSAEPPAPTPPPERSAPEPAPPADQPTAPPADQSDADPGSLGIADVRRLWPQVLESVKTLRRFTWIMLSQNAQVVSLEGTTLTVALVNAGARDSFVGSGSAEFLQKALHEVLGVTWGIETIVDPSVDPRAASTPAPSAPQQPAAPSAAAAPAPSDVAPPSSQPEEPGSSGRGVGAPESVLQAMSGPAPERVDPDAAVDLDDPVVDTGGDPEQLLSRELGARVIDEIDHD
ncbi:DNA polymerase III subunit gamma and tau [Aeromicrobium sp. CTD01-1L150]|uniref:DNA polymerase III subunit gamma and tau n=1 Tax=Aeromicrobium sp. CTD01-1L150 TaxID=3341830 RepID=UPI0035BF004F